MLIKDKGIKKVKTNADWLKMSLLLRLVNMTTAPNNSNNINKGYFGKIYRVQKECVTISQDIGWADGTS